jgi:hypothetical protein
MCVLFIIAMTSMVISGCSDSNLPNYVSGNDRGTASGIISHGDYRVSGAIGFVSFVNTVTGNAEIASVSTISPSTSVFSLDLPQGSYTVEVAEGALAFIPSSDEFLTGTVTYETPTEKIAIFGGFSSLVPVIGVTYKD